MQMMPGKKLGVAVFCNNGAASVASILINHIFDRVCGNEPVPWLDFSSGYVQRAIGKFPKQGSKAPWKLHQNYALDLMTLRYSGLEDGVLEFSNPVPRRNDVRVKTAA